MKAYTDLEQSRKLAEILPIDSADMCWTNHCYGSIRSSLTVSSKTIEEYKNLLTRFADLTDIDVFYPCWSLAALLSIIPQEIFDGKYIIDITEGCDGKWVITYDYIDNKSLSFYGLSSSASNLVDACTDIIIKLKERNIL